MNEVEYDKIRKKMEEERNRVVNSHYQEYPRLISGLRERTLNRLFEADLLNFGVVPLQRR